MKAAVEQAIADAIGKADAAFGYSFNLMEIAEVISATRLRLVRAYAGGSVGGVVYDIIPTSADLTTVIERLNTLITRYRAVVDGIGQGRFPDGTAAAPGFRFDADQDTGIFRSGADEVGISTGGLQRARFNAGGLTLFSEYMNVTGGGTAEPDRNPERRRVVVHRRRGSRSE